MPWRSFLRGGSRAKYPHHDACHFEGMSEGAAIPGGGGTVTPGLRSSCGDGQLAGGSGGRDTPRGDPVTSGPSALQRAGGRPPGRAPSGGTWLTTTARYFAAGPHHASPQPDVTFEKVNKCLSASGAWTLISGGRGGIFTPPSPNTHMDLNTLPRACS